MKGFMGFLYILAGLTAVFTLLPIGCREYWKSNPITVGESQNFAILLTGIGSLFICIAMAYRSIVTTYLQFKQASSPIGNVSENVVNPPSPPSPGGEVLADSSIKEKIGEEKTINVAALAGEYTADLLRTRGYFSIKNAADVKIVKEKIEKKLKKEFNFEEIRQTIAESTLFKNVEGRLSFIDAPKPLTSEQAGYKSAIEKAARKSAQRQYEGAINNKTNRLYTDKDIEMQVQLLMDRIRDISNGDFRQYYLDNIAPQKAEMDENQEEYTDYSGQDGTERILAGQAVGQSY